LPQDTMWPSAPAGQHPRPTRAIGSPPDTGDVAGTRGQAVTRPRAPQQTHRRPEPQWSETTICSQCRPRSTRPTC